MTILKRRLARFNRNLIRKIKIGLVVAIPIILMTFWGTYQVNQFFDQYTLKFQNPLQSPILIESRPVALSYEIEAKTPLKWQILGLEGIEKDICIRFGAECEVALAVSKAENINHQCDLVMKNKNNSSDTGLFQINSIHWGKYSQRQLLDCQTNLNAAYELYQENSWNIWVAYLNGSYKKFLTN